MPEPVWAKPPPGTLLFATDLSARCDRALDRAVILAQEWRARLFAVHAIEETDALYTTGLQQPRPSWQRPPEPAQVAEEQLRHDMRHGGRIAGTVVERGEPVEVILRALDAYKCALIITGIARDETLGRFILGRTVDCLLRSSAVPVLVVKQRARSMYRPITVAVDLSSASRSALHAAAAFFPTARLSIFYAYRAPMAALAEDPKRYRREYREVARRECEAFLDGCSSPAEQRRQFELTIEPGDPNYLLRQYVRDRRIQLVVLGTHNQSALFDILVGARPRK